MDGWLKGWINGWMNDSVDEWLHICVMINI